MKLYLNVPYAEKDEAKALGARWNPRAKKWYFDGDRSDYIRFSKWLLQDTDDAVIATDYIHIIEGVYLKHHYSVKTGYSKTIGGKCFANHCDCCGALQGNWFLFSEPDSPLSSCTEGQELEDRMSRLKIKGIPIEDDLLLDWDIGFCSNDPAYLKYGKFEELILSTDPKNEYVTYEELYEV